MATFILYYTVKLHSMSVFIRQYPEPGTSPNEASDLPRHVCYRYLTYLKF